MDNLYIDNIAMLFTFLPKSAEQFYVEIRNDYYVYFFNQMKYYDFILQEVERLQEEAIDGVRESVAKQVYLYYIVLYFTLLYCTALYCTILYCTVLLYFL